MTELTPVVYHNIGSPTVLPLSSGATKLALTNDETSRPLLIGFPLASDRPANTVFPLIVRTGNAELSDRIPTIERAIAPGQVDRYSLSLRFDAATAPLSRMAPDVYRQFAEANPVRFGWTDRRPIGTLFLATAGAGYPNNPRGWFLDAALDAVSEGGRQAFADRLSAWADEALSVLKGMNAQGAIVWDIEGEELPHPVTYIGDPRLLGGLAPEMEPLADAFFRKFTDAGLSVGICIRPQIFEPASGERPARQTSATDPAQVLIEKIDYAKRRWGANLFYIDSNGDPSFPLSADVLLAVAGAHPDVLLIPEHEDFRHFTTSAPYNELRGGVASTPRPVRDTYPSAFSMINTADGKIDERFSELAEAVRGGDVLLFRGWYPDPANARIKELYRVVPDREAPNIRLYGVEDGAMLSGVSTFRLDATDSVGIGKVDFQVNGETIPLREFHYPYQLSLNTAVLGDGEHTLGVRVEDLSGNAATSELRFQTSNRMPEICSDLGREQFAGCYYESSDFQNLKAVLLHPRIEFDWSGQAPAEGVSSEGFSAVWQGAFTFDQGAYEFRLQLGGAARISIDGETVWSATNDPALPSAAFQHRLAPGLHVVRIEYAPRSGEVRAAVSWYRVKTF